MASRCESRVMPESTNRLSRAQRQFSVQLRYPGCPDGQFSQSSVTACRVSMCHVSTCRSAGPTGASWMPEKDLRRSDFAVGERDGALGTTGQEGIVCDQQECHTAGMQGIEQFEDCLGGCAVQIAGWFVG